MMKLDQNVLTEVMMILTCSIVPVKTHRKSKYEVYYCFITHQDILSYHRGKYS